ncbi:MAG TPA: tetratricopeptide repeat protein [Ktedonobacteraceae bacterium]|nr:tetratricopeptide repeat protein [Ktedonobacteraceae bacterium]
MAKKKNTAPAISQEDNRQIQQFLGHYHQLAKSLRAATTQGQIETLLAEMNDLSETAQMGLLRALVQERQVDAADILLAFNELAPNKNVRKEAKRSLIQLQGKKVLPDWRPPVEQLPALTVIESTNPPRFWKGLVTDSRDAGEVQLLLIFEQGENYRDARVFGFLLEFWRDGIKDCFTRVESKRSVDNFIAQMSMAMGDVVNKSCSLAEGRRLILEALAVNKKHGTVPHRDYRLNQSLIDSLILQASDLDEEDDLNDEDDDDDLDEVDIHGLDPMGVVVTFVESWVNGDFETAYDLLAVNSSLRQGFSKEEWVERRDAWADEANADGLEPNFIYEREAKKSGIWLPNRVSSRGSETKEIEAGWSIEVDTTPLDDTLPELPRATVVYEETNRHWFWTSYTLVQEGDDWRIQNMVDEGINAEALSVAELQKKVQEHDDLMQKITKKHQPTDPDAPKYLGDVLRHVMLAIYYTDILIKKSPLDQENYGMAVARTLSLEQFERCSTYLQKLIQGFDDHRAENLRGFAAIQKLLSEKYYDVGEDEYAENAEENAKDALRKSLAIEDSPEAHISLAEFLIDPDEEYDEAEDHLMQAKALTTDPADLSHIEMHLGEIAMEREQYQEALKHYQLVLDHDPNVVDSWVDIAEAHKMLGNLEEAEASYRRAIELDAEDEDLYYDLSKMYADNKQLPKAIEVIEEGIDNNPDSAVLPVYMATIYMDMGDFRQAEPFVKMAERIDPDLEAVKMVRQIFELTRPKAFNRSPTVPKLSRPKNKRKR